MKSYGKEHYLKYHESLDSSDSIGKLWKKLTNHNMRKTAVKKVKAASVSESSIIKVTAHTTTRGLKNYDPGPE